MIIKDAAAEELAISARESLSSYCYKECSAYCCRRGYLLLNAVEIGLMKGAIKENLPMMPQHSETEEKIYIFNLGQKTTGCPNLLDFKCTIHTNPLRPKACKEYPLFIWKNKTILIADDCIGVKENKLYPFLADFKAMGYTLMYSEDRKRVVKNQQF
jgi:Fe-S-cluster containining protein